MRKILDLRDSDCVFSWICWDKEAELFILKPSPKDKFFSLKAGQAVGFPVVERQVQNYFDKVIRHNTYVNMVKEVLLPTQIIDAVIFDEEAVLKYENSPASFYNESLTPQGIPVAYGNLVHWFCVKDEKESELVTLSSRGVFKWSEPQYPEEVVF